MPETRFDNPIILDDVIPPSLFEKIQMIIMSQEFPWHFIPSTAQEFENNGVMDYSFYHSSFEANGAISPFNDIFHDAILTALDKFDVQIMDYYRTRLGLITAQKEAKIHTPHVDHHHPHHTLLLYVIDSDGDTHLYNKFSLAYSLDPHEKYEIMTTVTPKANRAVLFRGDQWHSSQVPLLNPSRVTINSNFTLKGYNYDKSYNYD